MIDMDFLKSKQVTVLGLARSGEAAASMLSKLGAHVLVSDLKSEEQVKDAVSRLTHEHPRIRFRLGGHPDEVIDNAELVVKSPGVPIDIPVLRKSRERGIPVIDEVELAYRVCRSPIIAITGTKGKSTTSTLLGQMLNRYWSGNVIVAGNIGKPITRYVLELTESDLLVLEVSSFQLEATVDFAPEVSVILNIKQDHFDRHSGIEDYASAKYRIFANQAEDGYTVLNADDPLTMACVNHTRAKVILFSSQQRLDKGIYVEGGEVIARYNGSSVAVAKTDEIRIPGRHNLENAMAAVAVSLIYGVDVEVIRDVLRDFPGLEHALEFVDEVRGVRFINDSKSTNVISLKAALESLNGNVILIMGGRDKGNDYTPLNLLVKEKVSHLILIGESADKIQKSIGVYTESHRSKDMEDAVNLAYSLANSGDTVLLSPACASFDMFRDYAERGAIFKEMVGKIAEAEK
jgi:UDP-N-acetylmuramoylalanine--D-glutamate ligase